MFTCMLDFISMFAVQFELQVQFELLLKAHGQCEERCHHVCHVSVPPINFSADVWK